MKKNLIQITSLTIFAVTFASLGHSSAIAPVVEPRIRPASSNTGPVTVNAEGFDSCASDPSPQNINAFAHQGNYSFVGFYLGGDTAVHTGCQIQKAPWVDGIASNISLVPIYDSLQSPCSTNTYTFSSDPDTAYQQGQNVGANAINAMANADLVTYQSVVYLNLEQIDSNSTACKDSAKKFVSGFVLRVHQGLYTAGLYDSVSSGPVYMYASIDNPPDDIWVAEANGSATGGTMDSDFNPDDWHSGNWTGHHRLHQWSQQHFETYAGHQIKVDDDCANADVDGNNNVSGGC